MIDFTCGAGGCIDAAAVMTIILGLFGSWALGFGMGKSVAWIRALRSAG